MTNILILTKEDYYDRLNSTYLVKIQIKCNEMILYSVLKDTLMLGIMKI